MMSDVIARLADIGITIKSAKPGTNQYTTCPQCSPHRKKANQRKACLSVKVDHDGGAVWNCQHCPWSGNIPSRTGRPSTHQQERPEPKPASRHRRRQPESMFKLFEGWGISREVVEFLDIHVAKTWFPQLEAEAWSVAFPYMVDGQTVNHKYRHPEKHFRQDKDARHCFYNRDSLKDTVEAIFVEGEKDVAAILEALGQNTACVSLPDGAPNKESEIDDPDAKRFYPIEEAADLLVPIRKYILAGDADETGELWKRAMAKRLGPVQCWVVTWPDGLKDAQAVLKKLGPEAVRQAIGAAVGYPLEGLRTIDRGELLRFRNSPRLETFEIGDPVLDPCLKLRPGQIMTVSGWPGDGKSEWVDWVAVQMTMRFGWRWAIYTPEHDVEEHASKIVEKYIGQPFLDYGSNTLRMNDDAVGLGEAWMRANWTYIVSEDETRLPTLDFLLERTREAWLRNRIKGAILDPYNKIRHEYQGRETDYVAAFMQRLLTFARHHDMLFILVAHPAKISRDNRGKRPVPTLHDISGSQNFYNATNIGVVVHRESQKDFDVNVHVQKVKRKDQGHKSIVKMRWNKDTGRYEGRIDG